MAMIYRVPAPTNTNGVRLFKRGDKIDIEYQAGEVHLGGMAYDSALGTHARNITIRPKRPDFDRIIADAKRKVYGRDAMPKAGVPPIEDEDPEDDTGDAGEIQASKLLSYLERYLEPDQMEAVKSILSSGDAPDNDAGEPHDYATDRNRAARLAADAARRRPLSAPTEREALKMFPNWNRLS